MQHQEQISPGEVVNLDQNIRALLPLHSPLGMLSSIASQTVYPLSASRFTYSIIPFVVEKADIVNNQFIIESRPYFAEVKLYPALESGTQLVFTDNSFAKTFTTEEKWTDLHTDVDPWMDEIFTSGLALRPSITYSCSCPNYSHTLLAMPQSNQDGNTRKANRQQRYPLPTAMSPDEFDMIGQNKVAGKAASWETDKHRLSFKLCKHVIASMFNDDVRVREPNQYPIGSDNRNSNAAEKFNEKLVQEIINSANELKNFDKIVLPGQGSFKQCYQSLLSIDGIIDELTNVVLDKQKPILGICVGMQLFSSLYL